MIRLSVRGLAKFMTSSPVAQRKVLRDYKYPDEDEPSAMRRYYKEALDRIVAFHRAGHERHWLVDKAQEVAELARLTPGQAGLRLKHNSRALLAYERGFATRPLELQSQLRLSLVLGNVTVSVTPELNAIERRRPRLVKLDFSRIQPSEECVKIVSQVMLEASAGNVLGVSSSSISYFDVTRGSEHRRARAGSRTLREVEAACTNIESLWPGI